MAELQNRWEAAPFSTYFRNSFFIAAVCMLIEVVFSSLAAYAFAKMNFFKERALRALFLYHDDPRRGDAHSQLHHPGQLRRSTPITP